MPATPANPPSAIPSARTVLLWTGLIVAILLPVCAGLLLGLATLMPGCYGGSGGSAMSGCELGGLKLDWLLALLMPAIVLSFVTVPVGLLLCLIGLFMPRKKAAAPVVDDEVDTQVLAALRDLRAGRAARTRCPRCRAVILLAAGRAPDGAMRVDSTCACGACDDSLELAGKAA